jgi:hypothetical protein
MRQRESHYLLAKKFIRTYPPSAKVTDTIIFHEKKERRRAYTLYMSHIHKGKV